MSAHTPGPWAVHGDDANLIAATDGRMMVGEFLHDHIIERWRRPLAEAQANARLAASAPDLLTALEGMLNALPADDCWCEPVRTTYGCAPCIARAAIAKARGTK